MPLDRLAAIASMCFTCGSERFISFAAAAAAAKVPMVPDEWNPLL